MDLESATLEHLGSAKRVTMDKDNSTIIDGAGDAEAIKAQLIAMGEDIDDPGALGDDFMLQNYYPEKEQLEIQKLFGSGFTESLVELAPGQWHGPVLSGYGVHLVYLSGISEPPPTVFAEVRERVAEDWKTDRSEELNETFYANLRDSYTVVIEESEQNDRVAAASEPTP